MTDERLEELIGAWMHASVATESDARESASTILERLEGEDPGTRRPWWRGGHFAPYLQAAAAMALVALVGAFLLLTLRPTEPAPERSQNVLVGASHSPAATAEAADPPGPPIRWQTDEVSLYADGMTLHIGDEPYTGRDASFWVETSGSDGRRWVLTAAWKEDDQEHLLEFDFTVDGDDSWISSVKHERPDIYGPDGARYEGVTWLQDADPRVTPGHPATGDVRLAGSTRMPSCQPLVSSELDVVLELSGLELTVQPKEPSPLGELADRVLGPRSPIGRALDPPPGPQTRYVELECPGPEPMAVKIGRWDLLAEPVGVGAWRVLGDGVHELDETIVDVAVGPDGSTVVATMDRLLWLGSDAPPVSTTTLVPWPSRVKIAPDGSVLLVGGERRYRKNVLAALDGGRQTGLPSYGQSEARTVGSGDIYDPTWDAAGTLWVGVSGGVGSLRDGEWEHHSRYEYAPIVASYRAISHGATRSLAADPDGELWVGTGHTFSQYHDGRWIEHDPLRGVVDSLVGPAGDGLEAKPYDLKIDEGGTMWALTGVYADRGARGFAGRTMLVRRVGDEWSIYPWESVAPGEGLESQHIAVHDGAVMLLVGKSSREPGAEPSESRLVRFDGATTTGLARLPAGLGYRIADVGPDGAVWIVGGSAEGRYADRIHIVPPRAQPAAE